MSVMDTPQNRLRDTANNAMWRGRFAPSPSGNLHFGSLVAALGSYLIAKSQSGEWLVRIEDIDPPREVAGAATAILKTLEAFGLEWDGQVLYQSQRLDHYQKVLQQLSRLGVTYSCDCTRSQIQARSQGVYDGFCRNRSGQKQQKSAIRLRFSADFSQFSDEILGQCQFSSPADLQDFIIRRRDGLFAYQLAVVVDDIAQGINHVVRGADILDSTPRQNSLYHYLEHSPPRYYHLPLVIDPQGQKFSKQRLSPAIQPERAAQHLSMALKHLGQNPPAELAGEKPAEVLAWAVSHFQCQSIGREALAYPGAP